MEGNPETMNDPTGNRYVNDVGEGSGSFLTPQVFAQDSYAYVHQKRKPSLVASGLPPLTDATCLVSKNVTFYTIEQDVQRAERVEFMKICGVHVRLYMKQIGGWLLILTMSLSLLFVSCTTTPVPSVPKGFLQRRVDQLVSQSTLLKANQQGPFRLFTLPISFLPGATSVYRT